MTEAELIAAIVVLDAAAATEGLTNAELETLLDVLESAADAAAEAAAADAAAADAAAADARPDYYVAPGRSITSKRGILSGDVEAEITADDLAGGTDALDAFVKSGHVLRG